MPPAKPIPTPDLARVTDSEIRESIERAVAAVRAGPADARTWQHLGCVYDANDLDGVAEPCYRNAIELDPGDPQSAYWLACLLVEASRAPDAIALFESVQRARPDYAPAWWRCGAVRLDLGDPERALTDFDRALRLDASAVRVVVSKAECLLALHREREVESLLVAFKRERPQLSSAVDRVLGTALRRLDREADALPLLQRNHSEAPVPADPWLERVGVEVRGLPNTRAAASQLLSQARAAEAAQLLERERTAHPTDVRLLRLLGRALLSCGRTLDAAGVFQQAARVAPDNALVLAEFAEAQAQLGDLVHADESIQSALRLDPELAKSLAVHADLAMRKGATDEARAAFERAVVADPRNPSLHVGLALALATLGQRDLAMRAARRAEQLDPQSVPALSTLAYVCLERGATQDARVWLERARTLSASDPMVQSLTQRLAGAGGPR